MNISEKYRLRFGTLSSRGEIEFECTALLDSSYESIVIARKLNQMHPIEAKELLKEVIASINGEHFEQYFSIDRAYLSDNDGIEIAPPNIIIDGAVVLKLEEMKALLAEWIEFIEHHLKGEII